jgi:thiol-disulfide isomerase/thioredoxin
MQQGEAMRQIVLVGIALFGSGLWFAFGDEPKGPIARKFDEMKKKFDAEEADLKKKLEEAQDNDDRKAIAFSIKELSAITAGDAVELAEENPKDEAAVDAAVFALKLLGQHQVTNAAMDKATAIILDNHINSPKIQGALAQMSEAGAPGLRFLKTVAEKTSNKDVQAVATFYCACALDGDIAQAEALMNQDGAAKLRAEAIEMIEKAVKLAPEAKVGMEPLAKAAEVELASLRIGVGNPVPDVEGVGLDGKKAKLSSLRGKVVLFDFWATWCGPCRAMIPHEREMFEKLSKKNFVLLSVSADEKKDTVTEFLESEKMPWSHWWDGSRGPVAKMFKIRAFPTLYLIDAKGVIRKKWIGSPGNEALDKAVEELVAEAK